MARCMRIGPFVYFAAQAFMGTILLCHLSLDRMMYGALRLSSIYVLVSVMIVCLAARYSMVRRLASIVRHSVVYRILQVKI
jgi:hypothetical protein